MTGYDPDFLGGGVTVPHPTFVPELDNQILRRGALRDGIFADYPNYTVVMNRDERTAAYVAVNIDQESTDHWSGKLDKFDKWRPDDRVGTAYQLDDDYYEIPGYNTYHKGHLARRASVAFGATKTEAQDANDETYYYTNRALQHRFYNPDEWLKLEEWARTLDLDALDSPRSALGDRHGDGENEIDYNNRVCTFSGPIYGPNGRVVRYNNVIPANVPAAYFKVVCFRHKDTPADLSVRAYIMPQDSLALQNHIGAKFIDLDNYQVSIRLIEEVTGLQFAPAIATANPIFFHDNDYPRTLGVTRFPEVVEIDRDIDIIDPEQMRRPVRDHEVDVSITAAMINPVGNEAAGEWVSIANWTSDSIDLDGWTLVDRKDRTLVLAGPLEAGAAVRLNPLSPVRLSNAEAGVLQLFDAGGNRIDRARYTKAEAAQEGRAVVFGDHRRRLIDDFLRG